MDAKEEARAESTALQLVARAEQCTFGLARKLEKRGYDAACVGAVISRLIDLDLVNDQRFARLWLESRLRLARSPRRLLVSLCGRGIDRDTAETAIRTALDEETEWALMKRFVNKYSRKTVNKGAAALKYLLNSEGFSSQVIRRYFNND